MRVTLGICLKMAYIGCNGPAKDLDFYGALDKGDFDKLTEKFEKIGENLWAEMKAFDKKQLK